MPRQVLGGAWMLYLSCGFDDPGEHYGSSLLFPLCCGGDGAGGATEYNHDLRAQLAQLVLRVMCKCDTSCLT